MGRKKGSLIVDFKEVAPIKDEIEVKNINNIQKIGFIK